MDSGYLLDTHILVRWLLEPRRLSKNQARVPHNSRLAQTPVAISAMTLIEVGILVADRATTVKAPLHELFRQLAEDSLIRVMPVTIGIAEEFAAMGDALRDPADRTIVATARVHRLTLLTSDQRIIESGLVRTID